MGQSLCCLSLARQVFPDGLLPHLCQVHDVSVQSRDDFLTLFAFVVYLATGSTLALH